MKYFKVFSGKMANYLRHQGHWIVGTEPNMKKPWLDVFLFEDTEALRESITAYTEQLKDAQ